MTSPMQAAAYSEMPHTPQVKKVLRQWMQAYTPPQAFHHVVAWQASVVYANTVSADGIDAVAHAHAEPVLGGVGLHMRVRRGPAPRVWALVAVAECTYVMLSHHQRLMLVQQLQQLLKLTQLTR